MNKRETNSSVSDVLAAQRLRLIRTHGIGPKSYRRLLEQYETPETALRVVIKASEKRGKAAPVHPSLDDCFRELEALNRFGAEALFLDDSEYPQQLAAIDDAPPVIFIKGCRALLNKRVVGVVGARNASSGGMRLASTLSAGLSSSGFIVASGLARGIDASAHRAALEGGTIACIGGGLDVPYPQEHTDLYADIAEKGLLVSELPLGTQPQARHFPRRNRLISGLSEGVVLIEAGKRSGSLITARMAAEQGREVFAVPGSPLDPRSLGGNQLIKDGAALVETAQDIIQNLGERGAFETISPQITVQRPVATPENPSSARHNKPIAQTGDLLDFLSPTPTHIDEIVRLTGVPTNDLLAQFIELELAGKLIRHSGGRISRNYDE